MRASPAGAHGALSGAGDVRSGGWAGRAQELLEVPGKTPQRPWRSGLSLGPLGVSDAAHAGDHVVPAEHGNDLTCPPLQGRTPVPQCLLAHILIKYLSAMKRGGVSHPPRSQVTGKLSAASVPTLPSLLLLLTLCF